MFDGTYEKWRETRITKIISIFGKDFFKGKSILELGAGYGDTGRYFQTLGSSVTIAEGRPEHVEQIRALTNDADVIVLNQENPWDLGKKFDVIIHWGVLYHLDNWKRDLEITIRHSDIIFLESEVCDSDDPTVEVKLNEPNNYDQALQGTGTRPSAAMVEKCITDAGATFTRYDDSDINAYDHKYDWPVLNTKNAPGGQRRFWIIKK